MDLAGKGATVAQAADYLNKRKKSLTAKVLGQVSEMMCDAGVMRRVQSNRESYVMMGKRSRGASMNEPTRFGDFTRGLRSSVFF
mmetsp:Transcript_14995/g.41203  ORF Transcript_14995/g.41203 Transcript_14995/m.41203 type:complete len:84 (-) Transcript_14995:5-256(-)